LAEFSVAAAAQALMRHAPQTSRLLVCGGGAFNLHLMHRLAAQLPGVQVQSTAARGMPPQQVEALAFAWLAHAFDTRQPGNLDSVTGARGARVLGALYPAG
jgi:anhydro-N-acetylmuramic acid kinase